MDFRVRSNVNRVPVSEGMDQSEVKTKKFVIVNIYFFYFKYLST